MAFARNARKSGLCPVLQLPCPKGLLASLFSQDQPSPSPSHTCATASPSSQRQSPWLVAQAGNFSACLVSVSLTPVRSNLMLPLLIRKSNKYFNFSDWKRSGFFFHALKTQITEQACKYLSQRKGNRLVIFLAQECLQPLFIVSELIPLKGSFCIAPGGFKHMAKPLHFYPAHETLAALLRFWSIFPLCLVSGSAGRPVQP